MHNRQITSLFSWLTILVLIISACGPAVPTAETVQIDGEGTETEDFASFYTKFHTDSLFQIERISWPLKGNYVQDSAGLAKDLRYKREDWIMHRTMVDNPDFVQQFEPLTEDLYFEEIKARTGEYRIERRFARLNGGWNLIYYRVAGL